MVLLLLHWWYCTTSAVHKYGAEVFFMGRVTGQCVFFAIIPYRVSRCLCKNFPFRRPCHMINFALSLIDPFRYPFSPFSYRLQQNLCRNYRDSRKDQLSSTPFLSARECSLCLSNHWAKGKNNFAAARRPLSWLPERSFPCLSRIRQAIEISQPNK